MKVVLSIILINLMVVAAVGFGQSVMSATFEDAAPTAGTAAKNAGFDTSANATVESKVAAIINAALSMIGVIFLILMVYGGYIWMAARGDEAEAKKAKGIITMAIIGLAVVIAAYAISNFVVTRLVASTTTMPTTPGP